MLATSLKTAACRAAYHGGMLGLTASLVDPRGRCDAQGRFQILTYHRVGDDGDAYVPAISSEGFEQHMRCLRRHFHPMSLSDLLRAADRREVPSRAIAVTFDDGYEGVFNRALPILRRYQVPATVYLTTAPIDGAGSMWNDRIGIAIRATRCATTPPLLDIAPLPLCTDSERLTALQQILEALKPVAPREREGLTDAFARGLQVGMDDVPRMLNWEQVREMHAAGVDLGAHTISHPILSSLQPDEARHEIAGSKHIIEERLQAPVKHFAYPNGTPRDFNATTEQLVAEAGFASATSTTFGINTPATNRFALRRGGPWETDQAVFGVKLCWYRWRAPARDVGGQPAGGVG